MGGQLASSIALPVGGGARTAMQFAKLGAAMTPLPYNQINSAEEAAVANPGNVRDVEAPDERALLETRRFPNGGARPTYQRGPVNLVGFLRSGGGLRDEGSRFARPVAKV